jgi:hypothetical protein
VVAGSRESGLITHGASEGEQTLREDRLKELADADWRKLQAKRYLESPGRCDADGPAALPVGWWH